MPTHNGRESLARSVSVRRRGGCGKFGKHAAKAAVSLSLPSVRAAVAA